MTIIFVFRSTNRNTDNSYHVEHGNQITSHKNLPSAAQHTQKIADELTKNGDVVRVALRPTCDILQRGQQIRHCTTLNTTETQQFLKAYGCV